MSVLNFPQTKKNIILGESLKISELLYWADTNDFYFGFHLLGTTKENHCSAKVCTFATLTTKSVTYIMYEVEGGQFEVCNIINNDIIDTDIMISIFNDALGSYETWKELSVLRQ